MPYFSPSEVVGLKPELVELLEKARGYAHIPFIITSGFRDPAENTASGGVDDSAHTRGLAVDLRCSSSRNRLKMVSALILTGFTRIGVYDRHIHADIDPTLPQEVLWIGLSH